MSRENLEDNRPAKEVHNEDESNIAIGELKEKSSEWKPSPAKVQLTKLVLHPCERSSTTGVSKVLAEGEFCGKKSDQSIIQDELEKYKVAVSNLKTRPAILNSMEFVPLSNPTKMQLLQAATDSESANRASGSPSVEVPLALLSPFVTPRMKAAEEARVHRSLRYDFAKAVLMSKNTGQDTMEGPRAIAWLPLNAYDRSLSEEVLREYWEKKGTGKVSPKSWNETYPLEAPPKSSMRWRRLGIEAFVDGGLPTIQEEEQRRVRFDEEDMTSPVVEKQKGVIGDGESVGPMNGKPPREPMDATRQDEPLRPPRADIKPGINERCVLQSLLTLIFGALFFLVLSFCPCANASPSTMNPAEVPMQNMNVRIEPAMKMLHLMADRILGGIAAAVQPHGLLNMINRHFVRLLFYADHHRVSNIIISGRDAVLTEEGIHPEKGQYRRYRIVHGGLFDEDSSQTFIKITPVVAEIKVFEDLTVANPDAGPWKVPMMQGTPVPVVDSRAGRINPEQFLMGHPDVRQYIERSMGAELTGPGLPSERVHCGSDDVRLPDVRVERRRLVHSTRPRHVAHRFRIERPRRRGVAEEQGRRDGDGWKGRAGKGIEEGEVREAEAGRTRKEKLREGSWRRMK